jgi:putative ABC transport system substrate-binding protein
MRLEHEYVAEKLNGEVAEFRPVTESTKFELVINLKTAKVLALTIPPEVLARANRLIK